MRLLNVMPLFIATMVAGQPVLAATPHPYDSYKSQTVTVGKTRFAVEVVKVDFRNPKLKIQTLTGTNGTKCFRAPCRVRSLKSYVAESKAFAAINGTYFCPPDYASCASEPGSYYWLVWNNRKRAFVNQYQNQFNNGGLFTFFRDRTWRFYPETKWFTKSKIVDTIDRDGLTGAISNGPAFLDHGQYILTARDIAALDHKSHYVKTNRSGVGLRGTVMYLVVARKATVPDLGKIMRALKLEYALNLDGGGSTALWYRGGYKVGPGRDLPSAVVFSQ